MVGVSLLCIDFFLGCLSRSPCGLARPGCPPANPRPSPLAPLRSRGGEHYPLALCGGYGARALLTAPLRAARCLALMALLSLLPARCWRAGAVGATCGGSSLAVPPLCALLVGWGLAQWGLRGALPFGLLRPCALLVGCSWVARWVFFGARSARDLSAGGHRTCAVLISLLAIANGLLPSELVLNFSTSTASPTKR